MTPAPLPAPDVATASPAPVPVSSDEYFRRAWERQGSPRYPVDEAALNSFRTIPSYPLSEKH